MKAGRGIGTKGGIRSLSSHFKDWCWCRLRVHHQAALTGSGGGSHSAGSSRVTRYWIHWSVLLQTPCITFEALAFLFNFPQCEGCHKSFHSQWITSETSQWLKCAQQNPQTARHLSSYTNVGFKDNWQPALLEQWNHFISPAGAN